MKDHKHQFTEVEGDRMECPCGISLGIIYEDEELDMVFSSEWMGEPYRQEKQRQ